MNKPIKQTLFWTPRLMGILFILFLSLFALDIFGQGYSFWETVVGLFMHLIPSILLAIAIALAWKWEWIGAALFGGWAISYFARAHGMPWSVYVLMAGIPFVVGILFLVNWIYRKEIRAR
ncbi:MAG: hypothetical protein M1282_19005 [Chloroflexi bacterium]|nr:hypothetical protein [Chloroflexota bacterium]